MKALLKMNFFAIFIPILVEQLMQTLLGNLDILMLSIYSDNAVAAVSQSNQIIVVAAMVLNIAPIGGFIILNQLFHSENSEKKDLIIKNTINLNFLVSLIVFAILFIFKNELLKLINTPKELMQMASTYLNVVGFSMIFQGIMASFGTIFRANTLVRVVMIISITSNVINGILNSLVVLTPFSLIGKGVLGVANATLISRVVSVILYLMLSAKLMKFDIKSLFKNSICKSSSYEICKLGVPSGFEGISYNVSQMILASMIGTLGAVAITSKAYAMSITSFVFMISASIAMTSQMIVAREIGKNHKDNAFTTGNFILKFSVLLIFAISALISLLSPFLVKILTRDLEIAGVVIKLVAMSILLEPGRCANSILISNLNAAGDVKFPVSVGIIETYLVTVPLSYYMIFQLNFGIYGIMLVMIIDEWQRASIIKLRWNKCDWKNIDLIN